MLYIGVDPGVKTGLAIWDTTQGGRFVDIMTGTIIEALARIRQMDIRAIAAVVIEDARRRKWIPREKSLSEFKGRAMGAGSVKRDSQIWEEFCSYYSIPLELVPPRPGLTKWTAEAFARITGWKGRTSNHARDAAMLVFQRNTPKTKLHHEGNTPV